uniref:Cadherin like and PC-esterase domain containing 1 n=1 Tax=Oreochromis niloticus TaxID=8128 RepID=A0A669F477_ORENI
MRCVLLLRRRSGPPLLLLALLLALCVYLMVGDEPVRSDVCYKVSSLQMLTRRFVCTLEALQRHAQLQLSSQRPPHRRRAVVLTGRHPASDTEVQLYQRVLQQMDYEVHLSRYAETSSFLRSTQGIGGWSLLLCLSTSEQSCLRRISFSHLQRHQTVNLLPGLVEAFSNVGGGLCRFYTHSQLTESSLPMNPHACGSTNQKLQIPLDSFPDSQAPPPALVAMVNVYVLVTSVSPLTSFLHDISVVMTIQHPRGQPVKVDTQLNVSGLSNDAFDQQITKDLILEDTLHFLLPPLSHLSSHTHLSSEREGSQYGGCTGTLGISLSEDEFLLLLHFQLLMKTSSAFQPLYPSVSSSSSLPRSLSDLPDLLTQIEGFYKLKTNRSCRTDEPPRQQPALSSSQDEGLCVDPHLRQIYTDPPLILTPPFHPLVKEYRTEVTFDTMTVRIRPEPVSSACRIHLDEHRGPRMANYPVGLGNSKISILVMDGSHPEPVIMSIYTVHVYRESRPSLPMFGYHVMCSFVQDCSLLVQPGRPCGLQPHSGSQSQRNACSSGHVSGRWVVPCLSCSDNRTCDWREVSWQPDGCYHPIVDHPLLQDCMKDRKLLFIGDSTNRGMMYFLMERVNSTLEDWGKAHDTLVYRNLNRGRTLVSYSYYPQFWLEKKQRPTFRQALQQLLNRSQPLVNSNQTVLVVGGVQWLNTNHLRTVSEVLDSESLSNILVVVKSLGMGFHLPVDGIRSLSLTEIQDLYRENDDIVTTAKHHGYEVIDTFSITMGRYKEFLQGRCACHFHEVTQLYLSANEALPVVRAAGLTADVLLCFLRWRSFGPQNLPVTERPPQTRTEQRELYIHSAANQPCQTRSRTRGLNPQPIVLEDQ